MESSQRLQPSASQLQGQPCKERKCVLYAAASVQQTCTSLGWSRSLLQMGLSCARPGPATRERDSHGMRGTGVKVAAICIPPIAN